MIRVAAIKYDALTISQHFDTPAQASAHVQCWVKENHLIAVVAHNTSNGETNKTIGMNCMALTTYDIAHLFGCCWPE